MRKFILAALAAAMIPGFAAAQPAPIYNGPNHSSTMHRDVHRDVRHEVQQDRRDLRRAVNQDRREFRREVKQDRRQYRRAVKQDRRYWRAESRQARKHPIWAQQRHRNWVRHHRYHRG